MQRGVCVCQRVPDQLYGTVPSLEQSPGLMFELRPLRRPLGCRFDGSLPLIEICVCLLKTVVLPDLRMFQSHYSIL